jgi:hypothetical protein
MSYEPLPAIVGNLFRKLANECGMTIAEPMCSGSFDQLLQNADSKTLSIRFVRDRGDEFLEVGDGSEWFSADLVRLVLLGGQPRDAPTDLQNDAHFVSQHFAEIEGMFSEKNRDDTIRRLTDMRMKKVRCMFPTAVKAETGQA